MDFKKANIAILVIMFGLVSMINEISACSCMPSHPQSEYCTAEYGESIKSHLSIKFLR